SSYVDRSAFTDDSESDVESLIENLKNIIMKKLSVSCMTESSVFFSIFSVSFSAASSQCSTSVPVSGSPAPTTSVLMISGFAISAFIISSPCFKEMLYRLNESYFSVCTLLLFLLTLRIIYYIKTIILIEDDNTAETILSHSQASSVTFSLSSAGKVMHISDCKCSVSDDFCYSFSSASSSFISSVFTSSVLTSDSADFILFFNFSTYT
ncbi:hypothetical protein BDDG_13082, partial [Blastomyces dermatitidis ATCC 18188]